MAEAVETPAPLRATPRRAVLQQTARVLPSCIPRPSALEPGNRRTPAPALGGRIVEPLDQRAARQRVANALALHADSPPVDEPDLVESGFHGGLQVGRH